MPTLRSLKLTKDSPTFAVHPSELIGILAFFIELLLLLLFKGKMSIKITNKNVIRC